MQSGCRTIVYALWLMLSLQAVANVVYQDSHVRFTLIDEGTIRLEYAPDGRFIDNKSFVAVIREYPKVACSVKDNARQVAVSTALFRLVYRKGSSPFTKDNLTITATKALSTPFAWKPGTAQKNNLKGTYRTLDGYDGSEYQHSNPKRQMSIEDGLLATDGWTLIDDSQRLLFDGDSDWEWVTERQSTEGA